MDHQPAPVARLPYRSARPLAPLDPDPSFRVGEAERAAACDALADHFAAGRLDPAELDDRLARAVAARSHADLQVLFRDLRPRRVPAEPPVGTTGERALGTRSVIPFLTSVLILSVMIAGGMLLVLGSYNGALLVAAVLGGTATAVAGGCVTAIGQATLRRR